MNHILNAIVNAGGQPYKVGGCVRDRLLGIENKDVDVEVYGLPIDRLIEVLSQFGSVQVVGKSFGVLKLRHCLEDFDFSLPRRDNKIGRGHQDFEIVVDHTLSPAEAAYRRDFTINAISESIHGELLDPYNGQNDLQEGILRATSEHFSEDPLRVLRGFQFAARFDLSVEAGTAELCRSLQSEFNTLPAERIWGEFQKWAEKGVKPSAGIKFLLDTGWLNLFPELFAMYNCPQDPDWHPEGCVLTHTMHVCDAAARIADRDLLQGDDRSTLILAALLHDVGKPLTTVRNDAGRWSSPGHAEAGVALANSFLHRIGCFPRIIERVLPLIKFHMAHVSLGEITPRIVRRLARNLDGVSINELANVMEADQSGRPPIAQGRHPKTQEIVEIAAQLDLQKKPEPIIKGRHLIAHFNLEPSPQFKLILNSLYEAQLDGVFSDEQGGIQLLQERQLQ